MLDSLTDYSIGSRKRVVLKSSNDGLSASYLLYGRIYSTKGALAKARAPVGTRVRRCAAGTTTTAPKTNYSGGLRGKTSYSRNSILRGSITYPGDIPRDHAAYRIQSGYCIFI